MGNSIGLGYFDSAHSLKVRVWHKFSKTIPHGWPENGCLFFTVNKGITIRELLEQINKHRRPEYHLRHLYKNNGDMYAMTDVVNSNDLYL
jgi:hypothetical protein